MVNPLGLSLSKSNIDWCDRLLSELPNDASDIQQKGEPVNEEGLAARWLAHADELQRLLLVIPVRDLVALLIGLFVIVHAVACDQYNDGGAVRCSTRRAINPGLSIPSQVAQCEVEAFCQ